MQELNHHPKGEIETEASYLNATSESCQLANPPTPRNTHSKASAELYELHGVFGRFDLAALCGCRTLNFCLFVFTFSSILRYHATRAYE